MKTIGDIVRGRELYSVRPESSVLEAADLMNSKNVGAVPVLEKNRLVGILSERDVLRRVVVRKLTPEDVPVSEVMTRNPVTCTPDCDVDDVMGQMSERRIAKVPVLNESKLVGIISVGDVIKVMYDKVHSENQHLMSYIHGSM